MAGLKWNEPAPVDSDHGAVHGVAEDLPDDVPLSKGQRPAAILGRGFMDGGGVVLGVPLVTHIHGFGVLDATATLGRWLAA